MGKKRHVTNYRIIFGDVDSMGIMYYSNYLRLFEIGRAELMRASGVPYSLVEKKGYHFPVVEAHLKYMKPALYDEIIMIETEIERVKRASLRFAYRLFKGDKKETIATGYTDHACLNHKKEVVRLPGFVINGIKEYL